MSFLAVVFTRHGSLLLAERENLLDAIAFADEWRLDCMRTLPMARLRLGVRYPSGDFMPRADLFAVLRASRVLRGLAPRRPDGPAAQRQAGPGAGGFTSLVTRKVSLKTDKTGAGETA
jgi:hypothetical protein